jgi:murein DD-endopeptidase MepM/ murein hydrolase activator NlpD
VGEEAAMLGMVVSCLLVLPGPVTEPFAPEGAYGGHWGVDVAADEGYPVVAPLDGVVSFAGSVVGVRTVTIRSGEFRVSLSYLASVDVETGNSVRRGDVVGTSGRHGGVGSVHIGLRRGDDYVDPVRFSHCGPNLRGTLRLLPPILPPPALKD